MPTQTYRTKTGEKVPSVTTVLSILNAPALIAWGYTQGIDNYNRLINKILSIPDEEFSKDRIRNVIDRFEVTKLYDIRDKMATAGTYAHAMIEKYLNGQSVDDVIKDETDDTIKNKAKWCFESFLEWEKNHNFKIIKTECPLVSEQYKFGGCLDIGLVMDKTNIIDLKTSSDIYFKMKCQVSAYGMLWEENYGEKIEGYRILLLGNGEFREYYYQDLSKERNVFLWCLQIYNTLKELGEKL